MDKRIDTGITIGRERGFIRAGNEIPSAEVLITLDSLLSCVRPMYPKECILL